MSDLRRGCIGALVLLAIYTTVGNHTGRPADIGLRCLQGLVMMAIGFSFAVSLFGRRA